MLSKQEAESMYQMGSYSSFLLVNMLELRFEVGVGGGRGMTICAGSAASPSVRAKE